MKIGVEAGIFSAVKKNSVCNFEKNQKFLLYKLLQMLFLTTCIEGIFDFAQIKDVIFFFEIF